MTSNFNLGLQLYDRLDSKWKEFWHGENEIKFLTLRQFGSWCKPTLEYLKGQLVRNQWAEKRLAIALRKYVRMCSDKPDLRRLLYRHMLDEGRHYRTQLVRCQAMGLREKALSYEPDAAFAEIFEMAESWDTPLEMYVAHPMNNERLGGMAIEGMGNHFATYGDFDTALVMYNEALPDESQHTEYGPKYALAKYATPTLADRLEQIFDEMLSGSLQAYEREYSKNLKAAREATLRTASNEEKE